MLFADLFLSEELTAISPGMLAMIGGDRVIDETKRPKSLVSR